MSPARVTRALSSESQHEINSPAGAESPGATKLHTTSAGGSSHYRVESLKGRRRKTCVGLQVTLAVICIDIAQTTV